jgi:hypothetical protein
MKDKKTWQRMLTDIRSIKKSSDETFLPPWLFQHDDLIDALESATHLEKEKLINTLNHIHFTGGYIRALLRSAKYEDGILVNVIPEISIEDELTCTWNKSYAGFSLENFQLQYLIITDNQSITLIPARLLSISNTGFKILLPEKSYIISRRGTNRFHCQDVTAELMQSGFLARGELVDFSPLGFRIKVDPELPTSHHCFNPDNTANIRLNGNGKILFSGNCHSIRQKHDLYGWEIVLVPLSGFINRFQARKIRHPRRQITPSPITSFEHPFFKRRVQREIFDISTTGFSIYDDARDGVLMPGMVIHGVSIVYAGELKMNCTAQVIYRRKYNDNKVCCGLAILDMDIHNYSRLNRILGLNTDSHSCISTEVDMDALWEFFFNTGFIYPKKYKLMQDHREEFKNTYRKLYQENPEIARHFTYEQNGRIYGHMSMIRAYERAWMIHHHAARPIDNKMPGLQVLKQMILFLYGMYHLPSAKMDYVLCYFRPENKFPERVFGGFAREINNPQICSLDLFSYVTFPVGIPQKQLPPEWSLHESKLSELWELEQFYKHLSGGLLMNVLTLAKKDATYESLESTAERLGFLRKWSAFSLVYRGCLKAVFIVNQSDVGANLSELLNGIKALIIDPEDLPGELLSLAVVHLTGVYQLNNISLLIYPTNKYEGNCISYEKQYHLWITDMRHSNKFVEYVQRHFRMRYD